MLTAAIDVFPHMKDECMKIATIIAKLTFKFGTKDKGNSLCHGVAGNAYMLHNLYRCNLKLEK
jgi:hypothetical protein